MLGAVLTTLTILWNSAAVGTGQGQAAQVAIHFEPQSPTEAFVKAASGLSRLSQYRIPERGARMARRDD